ncbi:MAG: phage holin family protein [Oscillospiraceae bacterium]
MRKAMISTVILLAAVLDNLTGSAACTGAAAMFYIVNESLSILENRGAARRACAAEADAGARCGQIDVKFRKRGAPKRKAGRINPAKAA